MNTLRQRLVKLALEWEEAFGVAPHITSSLSELDAALLVGYEIQQYAEAVKGNTAVQKGYDFAYDGKRYQVKANRPSGKRGSKVSLVSKASNYEWDYLIWILYDRHYVVQEAYLWDVESYKSEFNEQKRLAPRHYRDKNRDLLASVRQAQNIE